MVQAIAAEHGGTDFRWATTPEERIELWQARHDAYYAALALRPGVEGLGDRRLRADLAAGRMHRRDQERSRRSRSMPSALVGHVGDGNFHLVFIIDPDKPGGNGRGRALNDRMVQRALAMDGTCTGEHGIGYGKMDFLVAEHGDAVAVMRTHQARARPRQHHEPGQDRPRLRRAQAARSG